MTSHANQQPAFSSLEPLSRPIQNDLTLLIPTIGRSMLHACLLSVLTGKRWPGSITVVDQGRIEDIARWLEEIASLGIATRYLPSADVGRARGLNQGLRQVDTEYVCITDDDCLVDEAWIATIATSLHTQSGRVITGQVRATGAEPMLNVALGEAAQVSIRPGKLFDRLSGGNFAAPMAAFWRVGLFDDDERLAFCEDGEWAYRALRRGLEIAFEPDAIVSHSGWRSSQERLHQYCGYALSQAAFSGKYLRRGDLFIAKRMLLNLGRAGRRWLAGTLNKNTEMAALGRAYVSQFPAGLWRGLRSSQRPPSLADARPDNPDAPAIALRQGANSIAVILLTFDQKQQTLRCLEHLLKQRKDDLAFDVVVWDNGSSDGTAAAIEAAYPSVRAFVSDDNLGVAGGRNAAAQATIDAIAPELLLFLDNDMVVAPGFVAGLANPFFADSADYLGQTQAKLRLADAPTLLNDGGGCRLQLWLGRSRPVGFGEVDNGQFDQATRCISCGGAMMVRASTFTQLQGFDEAFNPFGPEDLDFSLRLQRTGLEAWYMPQAMAYHDVNHTYGGGDFSESYAQHRARHWLRLMRRHARPLDWLGFALLGAPAIGIRVLLREGRKRNLAALRGLLRGVIGRS